LYGWHHLQVLLPTLWASYDKIEHVDHNVVREAIARTWADDVIPNLSGLIEIPALSPAFDSSWAATGHLRAAVDHVAAWAGSRASGALCEVVELDGRSPLLLVDVPATAVAGRPAGWPAVRARFR
jgi:hypothetical protein